MCSIVDVSVPCGKIPLNVFFILIKFSFSHFFFGTEIFSFTTIGKIHIEGVKSENFRPKQFRKKLSSEKFEIYSDKVHLKRQEKHQNARTTAHDRRAIENNLSN